jgi:hypothetical protein
VLLNEDHSLAPEIDKLAAAGRMSWEDAKATRAGTSCARR